MHKNRDPFYAPPLMLKWIATVLLLVGLAIFSLPFLFVGDIQRVGTGALVAVALVPLGIIWMFIQRAFIWFYFMFYWYVQGCVLSAIFVGLSFLLLVAPSNPRLGVPYLMPPAINPIWVLMGIVGVGVLVFVWVRRSPSVENDPSRPSIKKRQPDSVEDILRRSKQTIERDLE